MASVCTYLNFMGKTEEAFEFYKTVFGTDYVGEPMRMGAAPAAPDGPLLTADEQNMIMHVALPTLAGHLLMGTDMIESMGHQLVEGNNVSVMLVPDSRAEADDLFGKLSDGGSEVEPMDDMFWGDYFGSCCDRFGIRWMIDIASDVA